MTTIDISELEQHPYEIMQRVKRGETIEINEDDTVVARLTPMSAAVPAWRTEQPWTDLDALVHEISKYLPEQVDAVQELHDIRREL